MKKNPAFRNLLYLNNGPSSYNTDRPANFKLVEFDNDKSILLN